jgi:hypothetical protein
VEYIGGFVVRKVRKNVKCGACLSALVCTEEENTMKLVNVKD